MGGRAGVARTPLFPFCSYEAARKGAAAPAADSLARTWNRPVTSQASVGYSTTYGSMTVKDPLVGGSAAPGRPASVPAAVSARPAVAPRGLMPALDGHTSYHTSYGHYGDDPVLREGFSTRELDLGTSRGTESRIPGYSGHIPAAKRSAWEAPRADAKENMLLLDLGQYPRDQVPGSGIFFAREARNVKQHQEVTNRTTHGHFNQQVQMMAAGGGLKSVQVAPLNSATLKFFTGGGTYISENGKSEAQRYFGLKRPLEGVPAVLHPSKTTVYGQKFVK